jgi:hypothetical protein
LELFERHVFLFRRLALVILCSIIETVSLERLVSAFVGFVEARAVYILL